MKRKLKEAAVKLCMLDCHAIRVFRLDERLYASLDDAGDFAKTDRLFPAAIELVLRLNSGHILDTREFVDGRVPSDKSSEFISGISAAGIDAILKIPAPQKRVFGDFNDNLFVRLRDFLRDLEGKDE